MVFLLLIFISFCNHKQNEEIVATGFFQQVEVRDSLFLDSTSIAGTPFFQILQWDFEDGKFYLASKMNDFFIFDKNGSELSKINLGRVYTDTQKRPATYPNGMLTNYWIGEESYGFFLFGKNLLKTYDSEFNELYSKSLSSLNNDTYLNSYSLKQISKNEILFVRMESGQNEVKVYSYNPESFKEIFSFDFGFSSERAIVGNYGLDQIYILDTKGRFLGILDMKGKLEKEIELNQLVENALKGNDIFEKYFPKGFSKSLINSGFINEFSIDDEKITILVNLNIAKRLDDLENPYFLIQIEGDLGFIHQFKSVNSIRFDYKGNLKIIKEKNDGLLLEIKPIASIFSTTY